ncbi:hypothetical protein BaRGS_00037373 [Batillaria attramentaria]|uniref:Uncharacterized protein n=1 Tax=Batillaria attramentaria TaxID=370345 RepID=A0ABD0J9U5_9CAEN
MQGRGVDDLGKVLKRLALCIVQVRGVVDRGYYSVQASSVTCIVLLPVVDDCQYERSDRDVSLWLFTSRTFELLQGAMSTARPNLET